MTMTPRKLEANRRNALKSTGANTVKGKAASKMNALKHALLAKQVVVSGYKYQESPREFKKLCHEFFVSHAPVGPLEEMLVDQIVTAIWRLRRARTAESGEIALSVDSGWSSRDKHNPLTMILAMPRTIFSQPLHEQLECSMQGCHYLLFCLQNVREAFERDGELTEMALNDFKTSLLDKPDPRVIRLKELRAWLLANPEKLEAEALRKRHKEETMKYLDRQIRDLESLKDQRLEQEKVKERSQQAAALLPSADTMDKSLRYTTTLERQLYRAMNHLERLQRRRQGENIPAPVIMEISSRV